MTALHISIAAEPLFTIYGFTVTNSLVTTWVVMAVLILVGLYSKVFGTPKVIKILMMGIWSLCRDAMGEHASLVFPLIMTIFVFVALSNLIGLIPGVGSISFNGVHLFRSPSADLSTTLALGIVAFTSIQVMSVMRLGVGGSVGRFISLKNPMSFAIGPLEIVLEFAKIFSFGFRLLGNVFAGEVLLAVMTYLVPLVLPAPFYGLEVAVSIIQAFIFALLTLIFISIATTSH
jgi:F-type H+-transporting ATPase subunit a